MSCLCFLLYFHCSERNDPAQPLQHLSRQEILRTRVCVCVWYVCVCAGMLDHFVISPEGRAG